MSSRRERSLVTHCLTAAPEGVFVEKAPLAGQALSGLQEGLFSDYCLSERLPGQPFWDRDGLAGLHARLLSIYDAHKMTLVPQNEENTRNDFLDPVLKALGYEYHRETATRSGTPDFALFASVQEKQEASPFHKKDWRQFFRRALTILEAKYWERRLENVVKEDLFPTSDASDQIVRYLMDVDVITNGAIQWGILTNGRPWRLFWNRARNRVTTLYEVDLPDVLQQPHGATPGSFDAFKRFVLFFEPRPSSATLPARPAWTSSPPAPSSTPSESPTASRRRSSIPTRGSLSASPAASRRGRLGTAQSCDGIPRHADQQARPWQEE
jgi:hypothetical protein